jgi:alkyldihydroxyacetonephosphate synthase
MSIDRSKIRWNGWGWTAYKDDLAGREELWLWLAEELGMPSLLATPARPLEEVALPAPRLATNVKTALIAVLGPDRVRDDTQERAFHALGRSYHDLLRLRAGDLSDAPDAILYPRGTEEVLALLKLASECDMAVVPFGGGTSVVGGVSAKRGPFCSLITIDLTGMDRILEIDTIARTAAVEAGLYGPALETALNAKGLTLGHFPQSFEFSTVGGWIAHRGAGQASNRYGRAEDWCLGTKLATPQGLLDTNSFPASSAGPQLNDLVIGSEGTFGIVTEATIRVHPAPKAQNYRGYLFRDFAGGASAIRAAVQEALPATLLRLSDPEETRFYRAFGALARKRGLRDRLADLYLARRGFGANASALIAGFEGDRDSVRQAQRRFAALARKFGAIDIGEGQGKRWREGRFHGPYLRDPMMDRGLGVDTLETAASWSRLDALYGAVRKALETAMIETVPRPGAHGVVMCHISHSYADGASLYFTYIFPRALGSEIEQWRAIKKAATDAIVAAGGTISHHHGVGEDHLPWMTREKGELGIEVLRAIKHTLDPKGVLNPGKLIP